MADAVKPDTKQRIRIRLKAYDHKVIDQASKQIIDSTQDWSLIGRTNTASNAQEYLHSC